MDLGDKVVVCPSSTLSDPADPWIFVLHMTSSAMGFYIYLLLLIFLKKIHSNIIFLNVLIFKTLDLSRDLMFRKFLVLCFFHLFFFSISFLNQLCRRKLRNVFSQKT